MKKDERMWEIEGSNEINYIPTMTGYFYYFSHIFFDKNSVCNQKMKNSATEITWDPDVDIYESRVDKC